MIIVILFAHQLNASLNRDFGERPSKLQDYYPLFIYLQINID